MKNLNLYFFIQQLINNLPGEGYVFINAKNVGIEHENGASDASNPEVEETVIAEPVVENLADIKEIIVGIVTFYFVYREAFECFDCFGGVGG